MLNDQDEPNQNQRITSLQSAFSQFGIRIKKSRMASLIATEHGNHCISEILQILSLTGIKSGSDLVFTIYTRNWMALNLCSFADVIEEWAEVSALYLNGQAASLDSPSVFSPLIIRELSNICFSNLCVLVVSKNSIRSIQSVTKLLTPVLGRLCLDHNLISSLSPFRKYHFSRNLNSLWLQNNVISQFREMSQIDWEGMNVFCAQFYFTENLNLGDGLTMFCMKSKLPNLNSLLMHSQSRIKGREKVSAKLTRKIFSA